jgi:hypothetical protein
MDRCRAEIAEAQNLLRAGHPDIEGLCLMLSDWSAELRLLQAEENAANPQTGGAVVLREVS